MRTTTRLVLAALVSVLCLGVVPAQANAAVTTHGAVYCCR